MNDSTNDSISPPPFSDSDHAGDSPMILYPHLRDLECRIAGRIVAWVNAHPEMPYYREYILMLTPDALFSKFMDDLAFGIYRHTDAATWLSWHDVPGSSSLLWRHAILRAAQQINA
jgi:hypothetical protein